MPRGGEREGAGRKPDREFWDRIRIGAEIEKRRAKAQDKKIEEAREEARDLWLADARRTADKEARAWARENGVSLKATDEEGHLVYRKAWRNSPLGGLKMKAGELHEKRVASILREIQCIPEGDPAEPARMRQVPVKRIKGPMTQIYCDVAAEEGISARAARRYHDEFKAFSDPPDDV